MRGAGAAAAAAGEPRRGVEYRGAMMGFTARAAASAAGDGQSAANRTVTGMGLTGSSRPTVARRPRGFVCGSVRGESGVQGA